MTEEEYFRKNYPDSCYGDRPLSPYWDFFQDGVEFGERQSEKKIEELEKKYKNLQTDYEVLSCSVGDFGELQDKLEEEQRKNNGLSDNLTKAKEIIREIMKYEIPTLDYEKAEQFLKEIEKCQSQKKH